MIKKLLCFFTVLLISCSVYAQDGYTERAKKYVEQYYALAIAEQVSSGIPASITLGQGILETEAGASVLMTQANNHFGIKCKNGWLGETILHTDDAKDECFKKYKCAQDSYKDHSAHLKNNARYAPLFKCSTTDYAAWAVGLKKCGYATNPKYAQKLIKIIEDFKLQEYTYAGLDSTLVNNYPALVDVSPNQSYSLDTMPAKKDYVKPSKDTAHIVAAVLKDTAITHAPQANLTDTVKKSAVTPDTSTAAIVQGDTSAIKSIADSASAMMKHNQEQAMIYAAPASDTSKVTIYNGLKAFYAHKDDMLLEYAVKYKVRYPHLLELNDLQDGPLPFDMYVYLEKKFTTGIRDKHTVKEGETLLMIAQEEAMQMKKLMSLNLLVPGEEPLVGSVLELQTPPGKKPLTKLFQGKAHKKNAILTGDEKDSTDNNLIATQKSELTSSPVTHTDTAVKDKPATVAANKSETEVSFGASFAPTDDEKKPDTVAVKPVDDSKNYIATTKSKPVPPPVQKEVKPLAMVEKTPVPPATPPVTASTVAKKDTAKTEDLSKLKSDLDKTVYTDPAKLPFMKNDPQQPQLNKPPTEKEYKKGDKFYIVKRGDTAYSIAKKHEITVAQLLKWNDTEPQDIKAGQTLKIKE